MRRVTWISLLTAGLMMGGLMLHPVDLWAQQGAANPGSAVPRAPGSGAIENGGPMQGAPGSPVAPLLGPSRSVWGASIYRRPLISEILAVRDQLGLSTAQTEQLQALRSGFEKQAIQTRAQIQLARVDLSDMLAASSTDLGKVDPLVHG